MKRFAASFMLSVLASPAATTALVVSRNEFRLRRSHHVAFSSMASQHSRHVARTAINLPQRQSTISMHMGHSHSHHDHRQETTGTSSSSSSSSTVLSNPNAQRNRRRRLATMLIFCAVAILGPPYWKHRALSEADIACFSVSAVALWAVGPVREQIKGMIRKLRDWSHGISRHSTGTSPWSFFQSNTAADRVTLLGAAMNLVLSSLKFGVGVACHSSALIADAGHSLSDLFSDFVTLWAVQVGRLPPDEDHPYGHGKFEAIGSLFLSLTLLGTGIGVGTMSNKKLLEILALQRQGLLQAASASTAIPGFAALVTAALSIVSKEWLYRVTRVVGERIRSPVVIANAWHHRSDAYSSVLALGSIGLARYVPGLLFADAAAGLFVAAMICATGVEILSESIKQLTDSSNDELVRQVTELASQNEDVENVVRVRARQVGSSASIDLSVSMPGDRPASAARAVEEQLKQQILRETVGVVDIDVRATTAADQVVCQQLEAKVMARRNQTDGAVGPTVEEVEGCVRDEIMRRHPEVSSVERVRVHFHGAIMVNVDVDIRIDPECSVEKATSLAEGLRQTLQRSSQINKASIYLDLNAHVPALVADKSEMAQ